MTSLQDDVMLKIPVLWLVSGAFDSLLQA